VIQPELAQRPLTVTELNGQIHDLLLQRFRGILVKGEVSGTRQVRGHVYFTLKDAGACVHSVIWASTARLLPFLPQDGQEMVATGSIDYYIQRGDIKLIVSKLEYDGEGKLRLVIEALKKQLASEGAFDPQRKRSLPFLPRRVALITSPTGAVIHDLQQTIWERFPNTHLLVYPAAVQGVASAQSVVNALAQCNRDRRAEVCIIARGGGSFEELMAFNLEPVARAILRSRIPVVTALGHTSDRTVADLVADLEARTPTAAAELVVPRRADLERMLVERGVRARRGAAHYLAARAHELALRRTRHPPFADPGRYLLDPQAARLRDTSRRLDAAGALELQRRHDRLIARQERLRSASPLNVLRARRRDASHRAQRLHLAHTGLRKRAEHEAARLSQLEDTLLRASGRRLREAAEQVGTRAQRLTLLSPERTLDRGYSVCYDAATDQIIRAFDETRVGAAIRVHLARGKLGARVRSAEGPGA